MQFTKGRYRVRLAETAADLDDVLELRSIAFRDGAGCDADPFDALCHHIRIDTAEGRLVGYVRLLPLPHGRTIAGSYSAQFYGLGGLSGFDRPMVEMGRFCIHPEEHDPDILRAVWAAVTRFVDQSGVELLFGCTSFPGTDAALYYDAFALLQDRHLAPACWRPEIKAPSVIRFRQGMRHDMSNPKCAARHMPALLRSYLAMGGWVSDHAVIDRDLNRLHVFTAVEIRQIPSSRARLLRALAH